MQMTNFAKRTIANVLAVVMTLGSVPYTGSSIGVMHAAASSKVEIDADMVANQAVDMLSVPEIAFKEGAWGEVEGGKTVYGREGFLGQAIAKTVGESAKADFNGQTGIKAYTVDANTLYPNNVGSDGNPQYFDLLGGMGAEKHTYYKEHGVNIGSVIAVEGENGIAYWQAVNVGTLNEAEPMSNVHNVSQSARREAENNNVGTIVITPDSFSVSVMKKANLEEAKAAFPQLAELNQPVGNQTSRVLSLSYKIKNGGKEQWKTFANSWHAYAMPKTFVGESQAVKAKSNTSGEWKGLGIGIVNYPGLQTIDGSKDNALLSVKTPDLNKSMIILAPMKAPTRSALTVETLVDGVASNAATKYQLFTDEECKNAASDVFNGVDGVNVTDGTYYVKGIQAPEGTVFVTTTPQTVVINKAAGKATFNCKSTTAKLEVKTYYVENGEDHYVDGTYAAYTDSERTEQVAGSPFVNSIMLPTDTTYYISAVTPPEGYIFADPTSVHTLHLPTDVAPRYLVIKAVDRKVSAKAMYKDQQLTATFQLYKDAECKVPVGEAFSDFTTALSGTYWVKPVSVQEGYKFESTAAKIAEIRNGDTEKIFNCLKTTPDNFDLTIDTTVGEKKITGVSYQLYSDADCKTPVGDPFVDTINKEEGTYYVKGVSAPEGYEFTNPDAVQKVVLDQNKTLTFECKAKEVTPEPPVVEKQTITATAFCGTKTIGGTYQLYSDAECKTPVGTEFTKTISVDKGTYFVKNISLDEGYELVATESQVKKVTPTGTSVIFNCQEKPVINTLYVQAFMETKNVNGTYQLFTNKDCTIPYGEEFTKKIDVIPGTYYVKNISLEEGYKVADGVDVKVAVSPRDTMIIFNCEIKPQEYTLMANAFAGEKHVDGTYQLYKDKECTVPYGEEFAKNATAIAGTYYVKNVSLEEGFKLKTENEVKTVQIPRDSTVIFNCETKPLTYKVSVSAFAGTDPVTGTYQVYADADCKTPIGEAFDKAFELEEGTYYVKNVTLQEGFQLKTPNEVKKVVLPGTSMVIFDCEVKPATYQLSAKTMMGEKAVEATYQVFADKDCKTPVGEAFGATTAVVAGTYYVKPVSIAEGYEFVSTDAKEVVVEANAEVTFECKVKVVDVIIALDAGNKPAPVDNTYTIYTDPECKTPIVENLKPNADGKIVDITLPEGTYYVKGVDVGNGFAKNDNIVKIEVNENNKEFDIRVLNTRQTVVLTLNVTDKDSKPVSGAIFELRLKTDAIAMNGNNVVAGDKGVVIGRFMTNAEGKIVVSEFGSAAFDTENHYDAITAESLIGKVDSADMNKLVNGMYEFVLVNDGFEAVNDNSVVADATWNENDKNAVKNVVVDAFMVKEIVKQANIKISGPENVERIVVKEGDALNVVVQMANIGNAAAKNVIVKIPVPAGTEYVPAQDSTAKFDAATNSVYFVYDTFGVGEKTETVKFKIVAKEAALIDADFDYVVNANSNDFNDGTIEWVEGGKLFAAQTLTVAHDSNVPSRVVVADKTFDLLMTAEHPAEVYGMTMEMVLPEGLEYVSASVNGKDEKANYNEQTRVVSFAARDFAEAKTEEYKITVNVDGKQIAPNTEKSYVTAPVLGVQRSKTIKDIVPFEMNQLVHKTENKLDVELKQPDTFEGKTDELTDDSSVTVVVAGEEIPSNFVVANNGSSDLTNVFVTQEIPEGMTFVKDKTMSSMKYNGPYKSGNKMVWVIEVLEPGEKWNFTTTMRVNENVAKLYEMNAAYGMGAEIDGNKIKLDGNNMVDAPSAVYQSVSFHKTAEDLTEEEMTRVGVGDEITYVMEIENKALLTKAVVSDKLVDGLEYVPGTLAVKTKGDADWTPIDIETFENTVAIGADTMPAGTSYVKFTAVIKSIESENGDILNKAVLECDKFTGTDKMDKVAIESETVKHITSLILTPEFELDTPTYVGDITIKKDVTVIKDGEKIKVKITLTNESPVSVKDLLLKETIPGMLEIVEAEDGKINKDDHTITWELDIPAKKSTSVEFELKCNNPDNKAVELEIKTECGIDGEWTQLPSIVYQTASLKHASSAEKAGKDEKSATYVKIGQKLTYTTTFAFVDEISDLKLTQFLPKNATLVKDSFKCLDKDGKEVDVDVDQKDGTLVYEIDELKGGEYKFVFDVTVDEPAEDSTSDNMIISHAVARFDANKESKDKVELISNIVAHKSNREKDPQLGFEGTSEVVLWSAIATISVCAIGAVAYMTFKKKEEDED